MNVVLPRPTFCRTLVWVRERPMFQVSSYYDTELRVSQEFFQPLLLANQPNLALQGSSKGSSFPSTLFLDRLFPENMVCQCDSLSNLAFSASASLGTQARSRKGPFTSWHRPHLLMGETLVIYTSGYISYLKKGLLTCWNKKCIYFHPVFILPHPYLMILILFRVFPLWFYISDFSFVCFVRDWIQNCFLFFDGFEIFEKKHYSGILKLEFKRDFFSF